MLKTRIISAVALAAAVALGATGCGFLVPQATLYEYAPSDGVNVNLPNVDVRNLLLVAGENEANVVFTVVNNSDQAQRVGIKFVQNGSQVAQGNVNAEPGLTVFGPEQQALVSIPNLMPGSTIEAYIESEGEEISKQVPVLDGTLAEYADLVPGS